MSRCTNCGSTDADIDLGLCFECFCGDNGAAEQQYPEPTTEDYCAAGEHSEYEHGGRCYCGKVLYDDAGAKREENQERQP